MQTMLSSSFGYRNKQTTRLRYLLWHLLGMAIILVISSIYAWDTYKFWIFPERRLFIWLIIISYIFSALLVTRILGFARAEPISAVFLSVGMAFFVSTVLILFGRLYYSRSFLLSAFTVCTIWQLLGWRLLRERLSLALVPGGLTDILAELPNVNWQVLAKPPSKIDAKALVTDPHVVASSDWIRFVAESSLKGIPIYNAAAVFENLTGRVSLDHYSERWLESFNLPLIYPILKRICDVGIILFTLPITIPLMAILALLIRHDSDGPALFWQERIGQGGHPFKIVKFRTMRLDSESNGAQFASDQDQRITRLGGLLRQLRLDEIPQFWNVLRGEMSIIGPRPEQAKFAQEFSQEIPLYAYRHLVKPGLTGWAQVNQGYAAGTAETREKLSYDLYYVKYLSFWLDLIIVVKTLRTILTGFGAR